MTYKDFDSMPAENENVAAVKKEIYNALEQIIAAFHNIFNNLVKNIELNISSEIRVLKIMLEQDGLLDKDHFNMRK